MATFNKIAQFIEETLSLADGSLSELGPDAGLLGEIPEFDSMAVVAVITGIEEMFEIQIDDDDITAETFATVGSLADYVDEKISA